jgi:hypothetical protein
VTIAHIIFMPVFLICGLILIALAVGKLFRPLPSTESEHLAADTIAALHRMEGRLAPLERILDADAPRWRSRV